MRKTVGKGRALSLIVAAASLMCALLVAHVPAHSSEAEKTERVAMASVIVPVRVNIMKEEAKPHATRVDTCLHILNAPHEAHNEHAKPKMYRPAAGHAAALGLALGVRIAVGPVETMKTRRGYQLADYEIRAQEHRGVRALAIADYRSCRNEQTLRTLTD